MSRTWGPPTAPGTSVAAPRTPAGRAGFTLLELVLVMLIMAVVLALVFPRFRSMGAGDVKLEARTLIGRIQGLYSEATFTRRVHRLVFDLDEQRYWGEVWDPNGRAFGPVDRAFMPEVRMPPGIALKDVTTPRAGKRQEGRTEIQFDPMGQVESATIHLEDDDGNALTLEVNPTTGKVAVQDGYVETVTG